MKNNSFTSGKGTLFLCVLLFAAVLSGLALGPVSMDFNSLLSGILRKDGFETESAILYSLRLVRVLAGLLAGAGLSCSGVLLQSVTGNQLASPGIIGVNSGAGFAVILLLCFFPYAYTAMAPVAFFGALLASLVILSLSSAAGFSKSAVILSGVAVSALLNAAISFISYADPDLVTLYNYFSVGSLSQSSPQKLIAPSVMILVCIAVAILFAKRIDTLCLGDSIALSLGVNVRLLRLVCLVLSAALAGAAVSFAGLLGFVGLVVPNLAKKLFGSSTRQMIVSSALMGGSLVIFSDLFGRTVLSPTEIPVGIVMAFIGAPFLFYLLIRRKKDA